LVELKLFKNECSGFVQLCSYLYKCNVTGQLLGFCSSEFEVFILVVPHHWVLVPDILRQHGLKRSYWPWRWRPRYCLKMSDIITQWHDATSQKNKSLNVLTGFTHLYRCTVHFVESFNEHIN